MQTPPGCCYMLKQLLLPYSKCCMGCSCPHSTACPNTPPYLNEWSQCLTQLHGSQGGRGLCTQLLAYTCKHRLKNTKRDFQIDRDLHGLFARREFNPIVICIAQQHCVPSSCNVITSQHVKKIQNSTTLQARSAGQGTYHQKLGLSEGFGDG